MDGCLRCSSRAVPYSGGGVTPVTLTPNFEFPITAANLNGKTMTASSPITTDDLRHIKFYIGEKFYWVQHEDGVYSLYDGAYSANPLNLSSDGLTITFGDGGEYGSELSFTSFTFNA